MDSFSAAQIVHHRLRRLFAGEHQSLSGLVFTSPSEYLGMMGTAEAMLYVLRLYETVLQSALKAIPTGDSSSEENATKSVVANKERIQTILSALGRGYDSDPLMRALPAWMDLLEESGDAAYQVILQQHGEADSKSFDFCVATKGPQIQELVSYFRADKSAAASDAIASASATTAAHATLANGVLMPVMGLGTWLLQGEQCASAVLEAIKVGYRYVKFVFCVVVVAFSNAIYVILQYTYIIYCAVKCFQ